MERFSSSVTHPSSSHRLLSTTSSINEIFCVYTEDLERCKDCKTPFLKYLWSCVLALVSASCLRKVPTVKTQLPWDFVGKVQGLLSESNLEGSVPQPNDVVKHSLVAWLMRLSHRRRNSNKRETRAWETQKGFSLATGLEKVSHKTGLSSSKCWNLCFSLLWWSWNVLTAQWRGSFQPLQFMVLIGWIAL